MFYPASCWTLICASVIHFIVLQCLLFENAVHKIVYMSNKSVSERVLICLSILRYSKKLMHYVSVLVCGIFTQ